MSRTFNSCNPCIKEDYIMKKFLVFVALMFTIPLVYATELIFVAQDLNKTVIPASSIIGVAQYADAQIKIYSKDIPTVLYYNNRKEFEEDYNKLINILKQKAYKECVKYGGGNACGKSL